MKYTILQKFYVNIIIESCWKLKEGEKLNRSLWPTFEQRYNVANFPIYFSFKRLNPWDPNVRFVYNEQSTILKDACILI